MKYSVCILLAIDAATFLIANLFLLSIVYKKTANSKLHENFFSEFKNGIQYLATKPSLSWFILIMLIPHVVTISQNIVTPGYVFYHLGADSVVYGIMNMSYGIGATITCLLFIMMSSIYFGRRTVYISFVISILSLYVIICTKTIAVVYIAMLFFGLANSSIKIILLSTIMRVVDTRYMGRAISVKNIVITTIQMLCSYPIGYMMDAYSSVIGYIFLELMMVTAFVCYIINTVELGEII